MPTADTAALRAYVRQYRWLTASIKTVQQYFLWPKKNTKLYGFQYSNNHWRLSPLGVVAQFPPPHPNSPCLPSSLFLPSCLLPFPFPLSFLLSTPALSPFSLPPLLNLGTWIQPWKNLANLDVRTCILMCIVYVENNHWALCKTWIYCHYFCFGHI